ncbi:MAG: oligosaccharide flippase family protein [Bacteroidales bacterium]|uniref:oligosaccharide flippase family protein n=1 Tax=Porphyromonas sp. TaxID=1924944 RepID=UPI0029791E40|nr:oligosaccharide flippase family protein [Porphyromonas sp.]MDD7437626.1 oligosaccharide flippase family protein [Bacteroidales bacterium]MDY3067646.1 oligosaccharide flippase family protein [Porphyromonas sp.]
MISNILKSLINRVRGNQDARTLIENFASLSILKALGLVLPLVTLPYLSRVIGVARFGDIAFASSITVYFMTITDYGFNYTATRDLSKNRGNMQYVRELFWNVLYTKLFLFVISTIIFAILVETIPLLREHRLLLWFTYLSVPCYMLFPEWFFQGIEKMKYITIVNIISKLLFTVLIFFVIKKEADYILHPVLSAFGLLVAGVISQVIIIHKYKVFPTSISWKSIISTLKSGWNIFFSLIVPNLYTNMSTTYLKMFSGSVGAGLFTSGRTFIDLSDQVTTVFSRVFFPFLSRRPEKHSFFSRILLVVSLGMGLALFVGADLLVSLFYSEAFRDSATVIKIMAICPLFLYLMNAFGTNYLVVIGKDKEYRQIVMWCSFLGLFVAYFSIKQFGYIGAAYTYVIIWGVRGLATWLLARKYKRQLVQ